MKLETLKRQYEPEFRAITTFEDADKVAIKLCGVYHTHGANLYGQMCEELAGVEVDNKPLGNRFYHRKDGRTLSALAVELIKDYTNSHLLANLWLPEFGQKIWPGYKSLSVRDNGVGFEGSLMFSTSVGGVDFLIVGDTVVLAEVEWKTNVCDWKLTFKIENLKAYYENYHDLPRYIVIIFKNRQKQIFGFTVMGYKAIKKMWDDYYREKPGIARALGCEKRYEVGENGKPKIAVQLYNQDVLSPTQIAQKIGTGKLSRHARPFSDYGIRAVKWDAPLPLGYKD